MNVTGHLDDTLFVADCPEILLIRGTQAGKLFQMLGFAINRDKSVLSLTQAIEFLGFIINSKDMSVSLAQKKVDKLKNLIKLGYHWWKLAKYQTLFKHCVETQSNRTGKPMGKLVYNDLWNREIKSLVN